MNSGLGSAMNIALSGGIDGLVLDRLAVSLRFYLKACDRLFLCFSFAFLILGVERVFMTMNEISKEKFNAVILIRPPAFILIFSRHR